MIISLRGASGSGKSTLARAIFTLYQRHRYRYQEGRKHPYYTIHGGSAGVGVTSTTNLVVPGHYEIANGGVDTLKSLDDAYNIARWADHMRYHCLMEGKCMSDGTSHVAALAHEKRDVRVVHIDVPLMQCAASVQARGHKIARHSIEKTHRKIAVNMETFKCMSSIQTFSGNREECLTEVRKWLGLS